MQVEAGHTYYIRGRKDENEFRVWLEDIEDEKVVGYKYLLDDYKDNTIHFIKEDNEKTSLELGQIIKINLCD